MKIIVAIFIVLSLLSCGARRGAKQAVSTHDDTSVRLDETSCAKGVSTDLPVKDFDHVPVSRHWKDIEPTAFVREAPSDEEVKKWAAEFEKANNIDSVWVGELSLYKSMDQLLCECDLIELLHGHLCEEFPRNDRRTEWRLLQYAGAGSTLTASELGKVLHLRAIWEDMLDRDLGSQMDMNLYAWLVNDMQEFQIRLMYEVCSKHLAPNAAAAFQAEKAAARKAQEATNAAYQKIDGTPDGFDGSSYPYRVASFRKIAFDMEMNALESFMRSLHADSLVVSEPFIPLDEAQKLVEGEYSVMESKFKEDDYSFPAKTRIEFMEKDKEAWHSWLRSRSKMSSFLSGRQKASYDNATLRMCRHKLIMLKNRYETGEFCPMYYERILLDYDKATTEEILSHDFEKLLEKEINS